MEHDLTNAHRDIHLEHSRNCFAGSLRALLDYFGVDGNFLTNRHTGFLYLNKNPKDYKKFYVSCFLIDDMLNALKDIEGIIFNVRKTDDVHEAEEELIKPLVENIPVMVFVDTFFLEFFPKKQGHEVHILVISKLDLKKKSVIFYSSLPYTGMIYLRKLAIARNSKISDEWIRNAWFEIYFSKNISLTKPYILSIIDSNIKNMSRIESPENEGLYGIHGMKNFRDDFKFWHDNLDPECFSQLLYNIFSQLLFLVDQRKRYVSFLLQISEVIDYDFSKIVKLYKRVAFNWEIFRNLCFKLSRASLGENNKLIDRLNLLIDQEEEALAELKTFQKNYYP